MLKDTRPKDVNLDTVVDALLSVADSNKKAAIWHLMQLETRPSHLIAKDLKEMFGERMSSSNITTSVERSFSDYNVGYSNRDDDPISVGLTEFGNEIKTLIYHLITWDYSMMQRGLPTREEIFGEYQGPDRNGPFTRYKILRKFIEGIRVEIDSLNEEIGITRNAVHYHIDHLESLGLVRRTTRRKPRSKNDNLNRLFCIELTELGRDILYKFIVPLEMYLTDHDEWIEIKRSYHSYESRLLKKMRYVLSNN